MTLDVHTPCPACSIVVRYLHDAAVVHVALLKAQQLPEDVARKLAESVANLEIATAMFQPYVNAHLENQEHAYSTELETARVGAVRLPELPRRPATVIPFPGDSDR